MENDSQKLDELIRRLEEISRKQEFFSEEIKNLRSEIQYLRLEEFSSETEEKAEQSESIVPVSEPKVPLQKPVVLKQPKQPSDLEKIIGESLINKIGILILVIGVAIGAKYSIENNLISPLTRIVLGYLSGVVLLGFGIKLKAKFESYSAVLVSGAMAIFYFITFFAYDFYGLIPQIMAFALMVIFTVFTVIAALNYNRSILAHIGLVGAYAVPFLLSDGSGNVTVLFSYIIIINLGILAVSIKRYWKSLYYVAFSFTWLIFAFWLVADYSGAEHKVLAFVFATIFFLMFYAVAVTNRIIQEKKLAKRDIILILLNSFIYFGLGFGILNSGNTGQYLGLFTLFNAVIHFAVGYIIRNRKLADKTLFYLVLGLVFTFITIAIPVQLDGNWVTLLWITQAVLLFWIGRTKQVAVYEKISYVIIVLTFFSLLHDWANYSYYGLKMQSFFNIIFLTSLLVLAGYGFIVYLGRKKQYFTSENQNGLTNVMNIAVPVLLGITSYFTFSNEINLYFENWFKNSTIHTNVTDTFNSSIHDNYFIPILKTVFIMGYSLLFFGLLSIVNTSKRSEERRVGKERRSR